MTDNIKVLEAMARVLLWVDDRFQRDAAGPFLDLEEFENLRAVSYSVKFLMERLERDVFEEGRSKGVISANP